MEHIKKHLRMFCAAHPKILGRIAATFAVPPNLPFPVTFVRFQQSGDGCNAPPRVSPTGLSPLGSRLRSVLPTAPTYRVSTVPRSLKADAAVLFSFNAVQYSVWNVLFYTMLSGESQEIFLNFAISFRESCKPKRTIESPSHF